MKENKISRRSFMKGATVGTVGLAALGLMSGCGSDGKKSDDTQNSTDTGFLMTYELAKQMNKEKFGVEVAAVTGSDTADNKYWEDGFIRMSNPEEQDANDRSQYYNIVRNLEITKSDGKVYNIYGMFQVPLNFNPEWLDKPEGRKFPVAIECHGYNTNSNGYLSAHWANSWCAQGYIAYAFDFVGGSSGQKENYSGGVRSGLKGAEPWGEYGDFWDHMSVKTEVEDLDLVIDEIKKLEFVNSDYLCIMGQSQGGVVCALEAAQREAAREEKGLGCDIAGMVLIYPAFSFVNDMHSQYPTLEDMENAIDPESGRVFIMGANIGPDYIKDCYEWGKYDEKLGAITIYDMVKGYSNSVLIVTGSGDTTVDPSWSYNAINQLVSPYGDSQSTLVLVSNAQHAFDMMGSTPTKQKLMAYDALTSYLKLNNLVPEQK